MLSIEEMAAFCKKKGFVYQSGEIYGGLSGFFDYGSLGTELNKNIKDSWWKFHVHNREDITGIDGSIITTPKTWVASGHVDGLVDVLTICDKCKKRHRADHIIEDQLGIDIEGAPLEEINKLLKKVKCSCKGGKLGDAQKFNLLFETSIGSLF